MVSSRLQPCQPVLPLPAPNAPPLGATALPEPGQVSLELLFLPLEVLNIFHLGGDDGITHDPRPGLEESP